MILYVSCSLNAQRSITYNTEKFPQEVIDSAIVSYRKLEDGLEKLNTCSWNNRIGKKVDTFWLKTEQGNFFGHVYEYFMDCDNLRLIYWSPNPQDINPIVDFMIEDLEEKSQFVTSSNKYLKNKKRYKHLLKN